MRRFVQCAWLSLVLAGASGERTRNRRRQLTTTPAPTSAPTSYFSYGNPSCPCIDTNVTNGTTLTTVIGESAFEYPGDYGSAVCKAHDVGLGDCVGSGAGNAYCAQSWCYVDAATCQSSALAYALTDIVLDREFYYSYDTCGGSSSFWDEFFEAKKHVLTGATLRVAVPSLFFPDHYLLDADNAVVEGRAPTIDEVGDLKGVYVDWFKAIAEAGDFELEWSVVSGGSLAEVSSAWDACILDVTKGLLDACPGNFWTTYDRLGRVRFSTPNVIDAFYFMALKNRIKRAGGLIYKLEKPFSPFSFSLWLCLFCTVVLIAAARAVVQPNAEPPAPRVGRTGLMNPTKDDPPKITRGAMGLVDTCARPADGSKPLTCESGQGHAGHLSQFGSLQQPELAVPFCGRTRPWKSSASVAARTSITSRLKRRVTPASGWLALQRTWVSSTSMTVKAAERLGLEGWGPSNMAPGFKCSRELAGNIAKGIATSKTGSRGP